MTYYKVKLKADQVRWSNPISKGSGDKDLQNYKHWHLIANELFTENQVNKMNFNKKQINTYFTKMELSKFKTYYFFGARFEKTKYS